MKMFPGRITADLATCGGRPFFKGTRIPVYVILEMLGHREDRQTIFLDYPDLNEQDVTDAMEYARLLAELPATSARAA